MSSLRLMRLLHIRKAQVTYPTGNPNFSVMQPWPSAFPPEESDPFLMCDMFGPKPSAGRITDPDEFEVPWHPHRGMDILTYLIEGVGRHADSLGNREEFQTPGMQWISVGSGIEHAEGGGTPAGQNTTGFQIWINVPAARKMDDPRYGTEPPENIPFLQPASGVSCRLLAGHMGDSTGPFRTTVDVQMVDYSLDAGALFEHFVQPVSLDNCLVYVYKGSGSVGGKSIKKHEAARFDATDPDARGVSLQAGPDGMSAMVFAGKRLNEPVAWRGPMVMNTDAEIQRAYSEYRSGTFLRKRAPWDYKRISAFPADRKGDGK
jgi:redox-sensitive bicupin YhaK (pirin superfamily)